MSCTDARIQAQNIRTANPDWSVRMCEADYVGTVAAWQARLHCLGLYDGPIDGNWGTNSRKAVQQDMANRYDYLGLVDGEWGPLTWSAIQRFAWQEGNYRGAIDGVPGPNTWRGIFLAVSDRD